MLREKYLTLSQIRETIDRFERQGLNINVPIFHNFDPCYRLTNISYKKEYKSFFAEFDTLEERLK